MVASLAKAEESSGTIRYPYGTAWLAGITLGSGAVFASNYKEPGIKKHFGFSMALGAGSEYLLRRSNYFAENRWQRLAMATGVALIPGVLKEMSDSRFNNGDLMADFLGSVAGALLSDVVQGPLQPMLSVQLGKDQFGLALYQPF